MNGNDEGGEGNLNDKRRCENMDDSQLLLQEQEAAEAAYLSRGAVSALQLRSHPTMS